METRKAKRRMRCHGRQWKHTANTRQSRLMRCLTAAVAESNAAVAPGGGGGGRFSSGACGPPLRPCPPAPAELAPSGGLAREGRCGVAERPAGGWPIALSCRAAGQKRAGSEPRKAVGARGKRQRRRQQRNVWQGVCKLGHRACARVCVPRAQCAVCARCCCARMRAACSCALCTCAQVHMRGQKRAAHPGDNSGSRLEHRIAAVRPANPPPNTCSQNTSRGRGRREGRGERREERGEDRGGERRRVCTYAYRGGVYTCG